MINDFEQILLSDLKDIKGLEGVSMFPLAVGWKIIIFLIILSLVVFGLVKLKQSLLKRSWMQKTKNELDIISQNISEDNFKQSLAKTTEILKRIAIQKYGRKEVANLTGNKWIEWLEIRDKKNLNWGKYKDLLVSYPYMSQASLNEKYNSNVKRTKDMIKSIKGWL